ncbi:hypothetical protein B0H63DRAFT_448662 [Podospora didyma]|uniref:protein-tyrosine-phosphatase n=1 Tax=Podospora didyma TaxID=330526 RepID=A0AAE0NUI4_9PEZI|nr:hypothetical protein B0H63DRAFT_448662 [Podospora didyma]
MMPPEQRINDRTAYYTMKTPGRLPPGSTHTSAHSRTSSQSFFTSKPPSSTPTTSPRVPLSVGQPYAPKLSPPGTGRAAAPDIRTPSPNYFGLAVEPIADLRDSTLLPRENWSPPTSSVKSFAAAIPKQMPLDANPDFEAFRRQVDANRGISGFSLSTGLTGGSPLVSTPSASQRPRPPPRWHTHGSETTEAPVARASGLLGGNTFMKDAADRKPSTDTNGLQDSAYASADSKRNSEASLNPPSFFNMGRHESPAQIDPAFAPPSSWGHSATSISRVDDRHPRLSLVHGRPGPPSPGPAKQQVRAGTLPPKADSTPLPPMISPAELEGLIVKADGADILLLDLRVSPQYAQSRVKGALNLCIPTTLLKRKMFNLKKLQETFQAVEEQQKFASWPNVSHLVVYDAFSPDQRDAVSAKNMIAKFTEAGYPGPASILRGGFKAFSAEYPDMIDRSSGRSSPSLSLDASALTGGARSNVPAVIGGVMLPTTSNSVNPFFNNIRQNQDLVDGVGQMDIGLPAGLDEARLPRWLREATKLSDHGKEVSDKFLRIELEEQLRMKAAYSVGQSHSDEHIQLSGIEKGGKNRYKDILPFEHARVRLMDRPDGACDYVNASHIQANRSHKRYIASQGPLPATFEDFWSVIWEQDVRVIVMLTAESEGGQLKCHPYWKGNEFGSIKLRALSETKHSLDIDKYRSNTTHEGRQAETSQAEGARRRANTTMMAPYNANGAATANAQPTLGSQPAGASEAPFVIIRRFALSHQAHPFSPMREITHLHYASWPDFGAPAQPSHLLALVELANAQQRATLPVNQSRTAGSSWQDAPESDECSRPMLVHCSAGCGRTGAFCTVDSVIDMLKRQKLQAIKHAGKRIEDRERLIRQQTNDTGRIKRQALDRDVDGDVSMTERADDVDRLASFEQPASFAMSGIKRDRSLDNKGIDTSWLDDESVDLIARTVEDFRGQRLSMVQSLRQFVLCYETVLEWINRLQDRSGSANGRGRARSGSLAS